MKKRIFLMIAIISMLACLLAISASAAEWFGEVEIIDNDGDGESDIVISDMLPQVIEKGNADGLPASEDALVKLNCTCEAGEHTFPAYYICTKKHGTGGKEFYELVFGDLNNAIKDYCGNTSGLGIANITALEVPNGYTVGDPHILNKSGSALKYFSFAKASTMTTLDDASSGYNWLESTPVVEINMGKYVTSIPSYFANNCKSLTTLVIPKESGITVINRYAFASCESLEGVYLPSTLVSLHGESGSFEGCKKLWLKNDPDETTKPAIYYFPASLTTLGGEIFKTCNNFNETVVLGANLTTINDGWAFQGTGIKKMICLGDMVTFNHALSGATVYFANPADKSESDVAIGKSWDKASMTPVFCHADGNTTHLAEKTVEIPAKCEVNASSVTYCFCGYEMATETYEGTALEHDWVAPTCTADGYCSLCGKAGEKTTAHDYVGVVTEPTCTENGYTTYTCLGCGDSYTEDEVPALEHNYVVVDLKYADGYLSDGIQKKECSKCFDVIEASAPALFEALGYSVPDDGSGEIAVSFKVNGEAITEFTRVTGKTVAYGVFAVLEERIGENSIFGDNGEIADGVICGELTGYGFTSFDLRITGLETDEYKATAIAMGAYAAISDGEATEYSCMQYGKPEQGASYEFVSYNDVKNNTSQAVNGGV